MAKAFYQLMWVLLSAIVPAVAWAQAESDHCAQARDPVQCEARQKALASCADMHGAYKRACLEAALPAVDCSRAKNPERCQAAQNAKVAAKAACQGKTDEELRTCLKAERTKAKQATKQAGKPRSKAKPSVKAKKKAKARKARTRQQ